MSSIGQKAGYQMILEGETTVRTSLYISSPSNLINHRRAWSKLIRHYTLHTLTQHPEGANHLLKWKRTNKIQRWYKCTTETGKTITSYFHILKLREMNVCVQAPQSMAFCLGRIDLNSCSSLLPFVVINTMNKSNLERKGFWYRIILYTVIVLIKDWMVNPEAVKG